MRNHPRAKPSLENHARNKLERWRLTTPAGVLSRRVLPRFSQLYRAVPPEVLAAAGRTMWNGWCTAARFQKETLCVLNCHQQGKDRIEHYAQCKFIKRLACKVFQIDPERVDLFTFWLLGNGMSKHELAYFAIIACSTHTVTNHYRKHPQLPSEQKD